MTNESIHNTGHAPLTDLIMDIVTDQLLDRPLSDQERTELQQLVASRLDDTSSTVRNNVNNTLNTKSVFTPPELAKAWGVSPDKVLGWIRSGELKAINVAKSMQGRPRYRIDAEAIEAFKRMRTNQSPPPKPARRRRKDPSVIEFF